MNNKKCSSCNVLMKRNGKASLGSQRWRCRDCDLSTIRSYESDSADFNAFIEWLLSKDVQRSCEKWFSEALKGYSVPEGFTYHGLRHTYASLMSAECLVAYRATQVLAGHKSYQPHMIYLHVELKHLREAAGKYSELFVARADKKLRLFCAHWMASPNGRAIGSCWHCECRETVPVTKSFSECVFDAFELKKSA